MSMDCAILEISIPRIVALEKSWSYFSSPMVYEMSEVKFDSFGGDDQLFGSPHVYVILLISEMLIQV